MVLSQLRPLLLEMAVILRWGSQPSRVIDTVMVEKNPLDFVAAAKDGLGELQRRVRGLVLIRSFINHNPKFHRALRNDVNDSVPLL